MSLRAAFTLLLLVLSLAITERAQAYTPPPMTGHVTDMAGKLSDGDRAAINQKLESYRLRTTNEVAVLILPSLDGEAMEDVGHATGRAWQLGVKGKDNGVLLLISVADRRARIDVGKGIEGALTDLQANDIVRQRIRPQMTPGHENYLAAVLAASDGIMAALDAGGAGGGTAKPTHPPPAAPSSVFMGLIFLILVFLVPIILFIVVIRAIAGAFTSNGQSANRGWSSGGTWSNDSSWSSGSNDSGFSGGGGGGGGDFTGGGGDFGGGGSSDSF